MQRIRNILDWKRVEAGSALNFGSPLRRRMRLDVNSPGPAQLFYCDTAGLVTFLALVNGRDVIEFEAYGEFAIQVEGNDCYIQSVDGENLAFDRSDSVTFTKIMERRARNPELELMQYMMRKNQEVMREQQERQFERMRAEFARNQPAPAPQPAPAGDAVGAAVEPQPDSGSGAGAGDPAGDGADPSGTGKKAK